MEAASATSTVFSSLSSHISQGHVLMLFPEEDVAATRNETEGEEEKVQHQHEEDEKHLVKKLGISHSNWNLLKRALQFQDDNSTTCEALLLAPTGKVLAAGALQEVEKEAKRFETCVALAIVANALEEQPIRRTADEWVVMFAEKETSPFNIAKNVKEATGTITTSTQPSPSTKDFNTDSLDQPFRLTADDRVDLYAREPSPEAKANDSEEKTAVGTLKAKKVPKSETPEPSTSARAVSASPRSTISAPPQLEQVAFSAPRPRAAVSEVQNKTVTKATRVAIRFSNGSPRQIIEVRDVTEMTFANLISQISQPNVTTLLLDYPRKEFTIAEHGPRTLDELELNANPSLTANIGTKSVLRGSGLEASSPLSLLWAFVWRWLLYIVAVLKGLLPQRNLPSEQRRLPQQVEGAVGAKRIDRSGGNNNIRGSSTNQNKDDKPPADKKPNEYWNGDSTVFEGHDD